MKNRYKFASFVFALMYLTGAVSLMVGLFGVFGAYQVGDESLSIGVGTASIGMILSGLFLLGFTQMAQAIVDNSNATQDLLEVLKSRQVNVASGRVEPTFGNES